MDYQLGQLFEVVKNPAPYPGNYAGRGIVISAGGEYLPSAYVAVKSLRHAGCTLPIQMWHLGPAEFPPVLHSVFTQYGVEPVDAYEVRKRHPFKNLTGWESKPYSIVYSPFREVFSFDADNLALINPDFLFDSPEFKQHGSIFWPDFASEKQEYWMIKPEAWTLLGLEPRKGEEIETGQVLIDKERSWKALWTALHMNEHSDFFYKHCTHGDTDTYTLAWLLQEQSRFLVPHQPKLLEDWVRIHYTPDGRELFQHSRKWVLPIDANPHLHSYRMEGLCKEWLSEFADALSNAMKG